jgi:hypothetical protein
MQSRAISATGILSYQKNTQTLGGKVHKRPFSNYNNQQQSLKRIKSELETIHEKHEGKTEQMQANQMYNNEFLVDESYSFSLRNFEKA